MDNSHSYNDWLKALVSALLTSGAVQDEIFSQLLPLSQVKVSS